MVKVSSTEAEFSLNTLTSIVPANPAGIVRPRSRMIFPTIILGEGPGIAISPQMIGKVTLLMSMP